MKNFTGAELIIKLLEAFGIKIVSGIPGGYNLPLYNALSKSNIRHILARHEQGAGFIAQGIARATGKPGVCFATSGPGAVNLVTAIADAKLDSIPLIAITGQVPTNYIGTSAFQELDICAMTKGITKRNYFVDDINKLADILIDAFNCAVSDRQGPVLIDIPKNIQLAEIEIDENIFTRLNFEKTEKQVSSEIIEKAAELINKAKRPVLYIGGGIIHSDASAELLLFAQKNSIPVISSLMGLSAFPADNELFIGMVGMHGSRAANTIINETDLVIGCGVRFGDRSTGKLDKFCANAKILHIDIDESEIDKLKKTNLSVIGDVKKILSSLFPLINQNKRVRWLNTTNKMKKMDAKLNNSFDYAHPAAIIKKIQNAAAKDAIIVTDVGQHQMWTAQNYRFNYPRTFLTSGGLGTMGFGLPAAIGAALAKPDKQIILITGDGSLLMNIQELATLADLNLNIKIIIMNNGHLGLVRQQQELFYDKNYFASKFQNAVNFGLISEGFKLRGERIIDINETEEILSKNFRYNGTVVIDMPIDSDANVLPMVPPGAANCEMIGA